MEISPVPRITVSSAQLLRKSSNFNVCHSCHRSSQLSFEAISAALPNVVKSVKLPVNRCADSLIAIETFDNPRR